jgi:hypothetical protein
MKKKVLVFRYILAILVFTFLIVGCQESGLIEKKVENKSQQEYQDLGVQMKDTQMRNIPIPPEFKSDFTSNYEEYKIQVKVILKDGTKFMGYMNIKIGKDNKLVGMQLSKNIFDKTGNDVDFLKRYANSNNLKSLKNHGECITTCEDEAEHPGWCKAGCWAETVGTALVGIAAIIVIFA